MGFVHAIWTGVASRKRRREVLCQRVSLAVGPPSKEMVKQVADWIRNAKNICFLTGAGVSVASGIPDFRSPGGMYDTLRPELLTATDEERAAMRHDPTYVVSWELFRNNPLPHLELRRPFILGINDADEPKWRATLSHYFMRRVHDEGKLCRVFTQNIDGLDYQTGVPSRKVVNVHGSLGKIHCEFCRTVADTAQFCADLKAQIRDIYEPENGPKTSTPILCEACGAAGLKPATVLFGSSLPDAFFEFCRTDLPECDLLIVAGTSLVVNPAASVPDMVRGRKVLVNNQHVSSGWNAFLEGQADATFKALLDELGWTQSVSDEYANDMCEASRALLLSDPA